MAATRLRKTFRYPDDQDDLGDDLTRMELDEEGYTLFSFLLLSSDLWSLLLQRPIFYRSSFVAHHLLLIFYCSSRVKTSPCSSQTLGLLHHDLWRYINLAQELELWLAGLLLSFDLLSF